MDEKVLTGEIVPFRHLGDPHQVQYLALLVEHAAGVRDGRLQRPGPFLRAFLAHPQLDQPVTQRVERGERGPLVVRGGLQLPDPRLQGVQAVQPDAHFLRPLALVAVEQHVSSFGAVGHGYTRSKSTETRLVSPVAGSNTSTRSSAAPK